MTAATATPARHSGEVAADVLARAKAGDRQAFAEVVRHYDHRLWALAYRLLGDRAAMDDALQEAYVKAFRALPAFREDSGLGTWLYQITYGTCVVPHLWGITGNIVVTVSGDLPRADLERVAGSLQPHRAG